jgi:hypothetical protein
MVSGAVVITGADGIGSAMVAAVVVVETMTVAEVLAPDIDTKLLELGLLHRG